MGIGNSPLLRSRTLGSRLLTGAGAPGGGYSAEASQFFSRITDPGTTRKDLYAALIDGLVADGNWSKLAVLDIFAADIRANAIINLKSSSYNPTIVNTPTFTADQGFTGNGTGYLNSQYNQTAGSASLNSHAEGIYVLNNRLSGAGSSLWGLVRTSGGPPTNQTYLAPWFSDNNFYSAINQSSTGLSGAASVVQGNWALSRTASNAFSIIRNETTFGSDTDASTNLPTDNAFILARNANGVVQQQSSDQAAAWWAGDGMSASDVNAVQSRINAYMAGLPSPINVY